MGVCICSAILLGRFRSDVDVIMPRAKVSLSDRIVLFAGSQKGIDKVNHFLHIEPRNK